MTSNFELFKMHLDDALDSIEHKITVKENQVQNEPFSKIADTQSLTDRCEIICEKFTPKKPTIRVLHHLASSGGTLISKCLAAMPNTFVLSEVHPYSNLHLQSDRSLFLPNDILSQCKQANVPQIDSLADDIFLNSIKSAHKHVTSYGGQLVLRDHSHSDYCLGTQVRGKKSIVELLTEDFNVLSVITLRNPMEAYVSMEKSRFLHFTPPTFAEYCKRVEAFLLAYKGVPVYLYEDFVAAPSKVMNAICDSLELDFHPMFEEIFSLFKMSGDSGRTGTVIEKREGTKEVKDFDSTFFEYPEISNFFDKKKSKKKVKTKLKK
jgi:hypothetical protein